MLVIALYFLTIYGIWVIDKHRDYLLRASLPISSQEYLQYKTYLLYAEITFILTFIYEVMMRFKNAFLKVSKANDLRFQSFLLLSYLGVVIAGNLIPLADSLIYKIFKLCQVILRVLCFLRKLGTLGKYNKDTKQLKFKLNIDKVLHI